MKGRQRMPTSADIARQRGRVSGLTRSYRNGERKPDDPALGIAQRDLTAMVLEVELSDYARKVLDAAPRLTEEQRAKLFDLLAPIREGLATT
jgi:hypothetical protein